MAIARKRLRKSQTFAYKCEVMNKLKDQQKPNLGEQPYTFQTNVILLHLSCLREVCEVYFVMNRAHNSYFCGIITVSKGKVSTQKADGCWLQCNYC